MVLLIGLCAALEVLYERSSFQQAAYFQIDFSNSNEVSDTLETNRVLFNTLRCFSRGGLAITAIILLLYFFRFSRNPLRGKVVSRQPIKDEHDIFNRLVWMQGERRFQFGIITLLALMTATAFVCIAITCPLTAT
jgi:hypothetical protein